jgi:hypothetical protein
MMKNKEKQVSEEQRELENTGDTGIDFSLFSKNYLNKAGFI